MKVMNIEFAPLRVPLERRLQTLAAAAWFFVMVFGNLVGLCIFIYGIFSSYRLINLLLIAYVIFMYYDRNTPRQGGRRYVMITFYVYPIHMEKYIYCHFLWFRMLDVQF